MAAFVLRPVAVLLLLSCLPLPTISQGLKHHQKEAHKITKTLSIPRDKNLRQVETSQEEFDVKVKMSGDLAPLADFPCPDSAAIAPCVCSIDEDYNVDLDCTAVESEEQLANVFQQEFPAKQLRGFNMTSNSNITVLGNILNGISFRTVNLSPGGFALEGISEYFLLEMKDNLTFIHVVFSQLTSGQFPFGVLDKMTELEVIEILGSQFTWIPKMFLGPKLSHVSFTNAHIETIESGTFPIGSGPLELVLMLNGITSVEPGSFYFADDYDSASDESLSILLDGNKLQLLQAGTFLFRKGPGELSLQSNQITYIEPGAFVLPQTIGTALESAIDISLYDNQIQSLDENTCVFRNGQMQFDFQRNQISSIEPGAFVMPQSTGFFSLWLSLSENLLTTVDEEVFGELLPFITIFFLHDNPLACGCDIAWIVTNADYMAKIDSGATCADGTNLHDLDPVLFGAVC